MNQLASIEEYEKYIYQLQNECDKIKYSTLILKRHSKFIAEVSGTVYFHKDIKLNIKELIDFYKKTIKAYSYEVTAKSDVRYWYDSQPHPNDPNLQSTHPHHKHIQPDIKHNRIPAIEMSFNQPNLEALIVEIESFI